MLTKEAQIVLRACKLNLNDEDDAYITENLTDDIDYAKFLYYCVHNRVVPLVWRNLQRLKLVKRLESTVRRSFRSIRNDIKMRNNTIYPEISAINNGFYEAGVKALLIKGAILAPLVYKDITLREFGDVDYLVSIDDIPRVTKVLSDLGYVQGSYDSDKREIIPASKQEKIFRRMNTHELVEFLKLRDNENSPVFMIDVNHSIFWKGDNKNRDKFLVDTGSILSDSRVVDLDDSKVYCMSPEHQLIQLCAHLYSEAVYFDWDAEWSRNKSEICLYRFCDLYEIISSFTIDWGKLGSIVEKNNIAEPIWFSLASLNILFGSCVSEEFLEGLNVDAKIIDRFYDREGNELYWNIHLAERLFNIEEKYKEALKLKIAK